MEIVIFGQQNWDFCWTAKQQFATRLARRDHRVLYVDPAPSADYLLSETAWTGWQSGEFPGLRAEDSESLWVYTPQTFAALGWRGSRLLDGAVLRSVLRYLGMQAPVAMVLHPAALPRLRWVRDSGLVYYTVDELTAFGGMETREQKAIRRLEEEVARQAEVCLGVSPRLVSRLKGLNPHAYLLQNGADNEHFAPERIARYAVHPSLSALSGPVLGFIGQVDERLDQELLQALAEARPEWQFVLAGRVKTGVDVSALERRENIHLLGYQPHETLPSIAKTVDVWLVPYRRTELTESCNPMKVYEYLATGRPVVSVPLEGLVAARETVALAEGAEGFEAAVSAALADREAGREARLAAAAAIDWERRTEELEERLAEAAERRERTKGKSRARRLLRPARRLRRLPGTAAGVNEYGQLDPLPPFSPTHRLAHHLVRSAGVAGYALRTAGQLLKGRRPAAVRRILVIRRSRLGDMIAFLPTLAALRRRWPRAHIALGVQPGTGLSPLVAGYVDEVIPLDYLWAGRPNSPRHLGRLFLRGWDLVLTGAKWFFLPEALYCGAPKWLGLHDNYNLQEVGGKMLPRDRNRHEAENNLQLVEALGEKVEPRWRMPVLRLDEASVRSRRDVVLKRLALPPEAELLVVHPGANRESRRWPLPQLGACLEALLESRPALHVAFSGTEQEGVLGADLARRLPERHQGRLHHMAGATDLPGLVALLDESAALLTNDTGVMHLARARGVPLAAVLGPEADRLWGPHPLGAAPAIALRRRVPCAPCARLECPHHFCLRSVAPQEVVEAVTALLERGREGEGLQTLERRMSTLGWGELARRGFELPTVTVLAVIPEEEREEAVAEAVGAAERQLYPEVEVVLVGRGIGRWRDGRDGEARRLLPIRQVEGDGDSPEALLRQGLAETRGDLVALWRRGETPWPRGRVGDEVAAYLREPRAAGYRKGRPVARVPEGEEAWNFTFPAEALCRRAGVKKRGEEEVPFGFVA